MKSLKPLKIRHQYDENGNVIMTLEDKIVTTFSRNQTFLKAFLGTIRFLYRIFSLPRYRDTHPWVSDKYTLGIKLPINKELYVDHMPMPYPIIDEFIEKASHIMIMNVCGCRQAAGCKNHPPEIGCINMGESVLEISPGIGHIATKEEARAHARKAIENGLVPYIGKGRIDNTLYQVPDRGKLLGLCFCCHCCCLTDAFMHLPSEHLNRLFPRIKEIKMEVTDDCTGCGTCVEYCHYHAITVENGKAVQNDFCRQCGRCATYCPSQAIKVSMTNFKFKEDIIKRISARVDLTSSVPSKG